jgi:phosphoglycolate phosphatase-like HAD superfamily hydrolase
MAGMRHSGWMRDLAFHFDAMRTAYPHEPLMIVFDIDGTIFDMRHIVLSVLKAYDAEHGTRFFEKLSWTDIAVPNQEIGDILKDFAIPEASHQDVVAWCRENRWARSAVIKSRRPFHGALDVIRWFQLQPNTSVGLNTSRSETLREDTLRILNALGEEYHVRFDDALISLNTGVPAPQGKADGINRFRKLGYRVIAVIDNERENLDAIARDEHAGEILLLHADSMPWSMPGGTARLPERGNFFDLTDLISPKKLPGPIELVWHGVDDEAILREFLVSSITWAELHVRMPVSGGDLILRRRSYADLPPDPQESPARLDDFLYILHDAGRGVKLDLKDPGLTPGVMELLKAAGFADERVWITINTEEMHRGGLRTIRDAFPRAVTQCPVDSLSRMMEETPVEARMHLDTLALEGIDRFSVNWGTPGSRRIIVRLQNWGFEVNVYNVPDLEAFLQAALLLPTSLTSFFNFPKWFYTGRSDAVEQPTMKGPWHLPL